jgi:prophage regulatory protein
MNIGKNRSTTAPHEVPPAHATKQHQPLEQLLPLTDVENITGLKKSKLYQLIAEDGFPKPYRLGARSVRWKSSDIQAWISNLSQEVAQ